MNENELGCVCDSVKNKANFMEVLSGGKLYLYHKRCPIHGITLLEDLPMVEVRIREVFTKKQLAILAGRLHKPELISVSEDNQTGVIEFSKWRFMTEDEKNKYNEANKKA